jgi:outer membrane receptor protein involved in Fe transport
MEEVIIVDVGAQHTFKLQGCDLTLRGYVNNVTDQDYQLSYGYDMPGTTAGMSMTLSF